MLSITEIMSAKAYHERGLPPGAMRRWAFLVTLEELEALVNECQTRPELGMVMNEQTAADIKVGRAALHINGLMIIPELMAPTDAATHVVNSMELPPGSA